MTTTLRFALGLLALAACTARAEPARATPVGVSAGASAAGAVAAKPRPHVMVIEDEGVRIEETRVHGAVQRVTVQSKVGGVRPYEVQVAPAGRDPSQERGNAGRRAWSILDF